MVTCSQHVCTGKYAPKTLNYLIKMEKHNRRLFTENIKEIKGYVKELINSNQSYLELYRETLERWLALPIMEYNDNQTRNDRKYKDVDDYIRRLEESRNKNIAMEMIVQVADRDFWANREHDRDKMENVYRDYLDFLSEEFPDFKIISCTFHNDEDSPHVHIVGIPIAEFDKGLKMRVSQRSVFTKEAMERLQEKGRDFLERSMQKWIDNEFRFDEKQKGRNHNYSVEALKERAESFKEFNGIEELREHQKMLSESISTLDEMLRKVDILGINNAKKKEKMKEVELRFEKFKNVFNKTVKTYSEEVTALQDSVKEIRLEDTRIEEIKKGLTRETKKKLGDIIRNDYVGSEDYNNFLKQVQEDLKIQMTNKLKRQLKHKELIEELERERGEFEKSREQRNNEILELDKELEKKHKTLLDMKNEISDLELKTSIVSSELKKYEKKKEEYVKILNEYKSMDIVKEYEAIKSRNSELKKENENLENNIESLKEETDQLKEEKKQLANDNTRLQSEINTKYGIKEFEEYFYTRGTEDLTDYFKSKGYDSERSRAKAENVLEAHFSLEMVLALENYASTGIMDERALYGSNENEKGSGYYEKYDRGNEI